METKISQISELSNLLEHKDSLNENFIRLFGLFGLERLLKQLSFKKEKGASAADLILLLCLFRINGPIKLQTARSLCYNVLFRHDDS
ncbi:MAG: hypothetical protein LBQ28_05755 [Prevotellaceae bacterium]|jgi:hypothetical protein|nr:hypothetical protein [Prevotellaceae bacterium]